MHRPSDISNVPPQCSACLSTATVSHCAICWGSHVSTGQAPGAYYKPVAAVSRAQLCAAAEKVPQAGCIADGFCDAVYLHITPLPSPTSGGTTSSSSGSTSSSLEGIALVDAIINNLGGAAVGNVAVQQPGAAAAAATTTTPTPSPSSSSSSSASSHRANGAVGLCGSYHCVLDRQ